jgi:DNA-binding LacI/PurR family transcriptional regulator
MGQRRIAAVALVAIRTTMMRVDASSPVPLYHQVELGLLLLIRSRGLQRGGVLPSEPELAVEFGVARLTVRRAVERLVHQGVLVRRRGVGTFVADLSRAQHTAPQPRHLLFVLPSMNSIVHLGTLAGAQEEARAHGYQLVITHSDRNPQFEAQQIASTRTTGASGLLLWPLGGATRREALNALREGNVPYVLVDRFIDDVESDYVVAADHAGAYSAVSHLVELGHQRIALVIFEDIDVSSVRLRRDGYRQALLDHGLSYDDDLVIRLPGRIQADILDQMTPLAETLLGRPIPPTAAFCINDHLAQSLLVTLERRGMRIPDQFSIAGFDGLDYLPTTLQLTTVRRATDDLGREAVRLLIRRIDGPPDPAPRHVVLPTKLVVRETTAPPLRHLAAKAAGAYRMRGGQDTADADSRTGRYPAADLSARGPGRDTRG